VQDGDDGLFKAKVVNEVDAERDRATPAYEARSADKLLSAVLQVDELLASTWTHPTFLPPPVACSRPASTSFIAL
jgi:hypothetical protein